MKFLTYLIVLHSSIAFSHICEKAQVMIAGINDLDFSVENHIHDEFESFLRSKPSSSDQLIETTSFFQPGSRLGYEASDSVGQIWCKMKSAEAFNNPPKKSCADINRFIVKERLQQMDQLDNLKNFQFEADNTFIRGDKWNKTPLIVSFARSNQVVSITASALKSPSWLPYIGGMHYCKLIDTSTVDDILAFLK